MGQQNRRGRHSVKWLERASKWLIPVLIVAEALLVWLRVIDLSTAIIVVVAIEALLLLASLRLLIVTVRRYRQDRLGGSDFWTAFESALADSLPRTLAHVIAIEIKVWHCLWLWASRRKKLGVNEFSYHRRSTVGPLLLVVFITTPVEILLFELLLPWDWLKILLVIAAVYALLWVLAFYASLIVLPHRLGARALLIQNGFMARAELPYDQIESIAAQRKRPPDGSEGLKSVAKENAAYLTVGGRTDVSVRLKTPGSVEGFLRSTPPVQTIHLAADDPERLVNELKARLALP